MEPLPKPVNPFLYVADEYQRDLGSVPPDRLDEALKQIAWLRWCGQHIQIQTQDPVIAYAYAKLAVSGQERAILPQILKQIDNLYATATR